MKVIRQVAYWGTKVVMLGGKEGGLSKASLFVSIERLPLLSFRLISESGVDVAVEYSNARVKETVKGGLREWEVTPTGGGCFKIGEAVMSWFDVESESSYKVTDFEGHVLSVQGKSCFEYMEDEKGARVVELKDKLCRLKGAVTKVLKGEGWTNESIDQLIEGIMMSAFDEGVLSDPESVVVECAEIRMCSAELLSLFGVTSPSH